MEETLSLLEEMRGKLENKTSEVASIKLEREEMGFLVLQAAQEAKVHSLRTTRPKIVHSLTHITSTSNAGPLD